MKTWGWVFCLCSLLLLTATPAVSGVDMKPGLWEITTNTRMQGMSIPPSTTTQCLTEDDVVPHNRQPGQECEIVDMETSGDTVTWRLECTGQGGRVESTGMIRYLGDRFEGSVTTEIDATGITVESTLEGKRLGPCN